MAAVGSSDELTAHDYHAQAALILGLCERILSPLHMAYVRVQFGREASGFDLLARHLAGSFGTGVHSRRGIEQIIRSYCGEKIGLRELRKSMACGMLKAASLRNGGYDLLDIDTHPGDGYPSWRNGAPRFIAQPGHAGDGIAKKRGKQGKKRRKSRDRADEAGSKSSYDPLLFH